ncbi:MAG: glycosyltransferase family 2 protein [Paludibacter sp.]
MKLSVITINYNNASGLQKTMESVMNQTSFDFEYIVVDGASKDGSLEVIQKFESLKKDIKMRWISEADKGIYDAMNKGILLAKGEYIQFLNSSDSFVNETVVERMLKELKVKSEKNAVQILYGNMIKQLPDRIFRDRCFNGEEITLLGMYTATLNHSPVLIKRILFDQFGLYDDKLKVVSDWKWYTQVIIHGGVKPEYVDIDVINFDMTGISSTNLDLTNREKKQEMYKIFPETILKDYERWAFHIDQIKRLQRHKWAYGCVWILERFLFKIEKWINKGEKI